MDGGAGILVARITRTFLTEYLIWNCFKQKKHFFFMINVTIFVFDENQISFTGTDGIPFFIINQQLFNL